jgi:hypothetical protein
MKLSAEQFAELAASFTSGDQASDTRERRRAARIELHARVKIIPVIAGRRLEPVLVEVYDFSARGICFLHATAMTVGDQFVTELPRQGGGRVQLLCSVANVQKVSPPAYRIGAEFICSVQPDARPISDEGGADVREVQRIRQSMLG